MHCVLSYMYIYLKKKKKAIIPTQGSNLRKTLE